MKGHENVAKLLIDRGAPIAAVDKVCKLVQSVNNTVSVQHSISSMCFHLQSRHCVTFLLDKDICKQLNVC